MRTLGGVVIGIVLGLVVGVHMRGASATSVPCLPPHGKIVLDVSGNGSKQTASFKAPGPFTVTWTLGAAPTAIVVTINAVNVRKDDILKGLLDSISSQKTGTDTSFEHVNCVTGCWLSITAIGSFHLTVSK